MKYVLLILGFAIAAWLDIYLRKKFNIERNVKFMDQYVNKLHFIIEMTLCIFFLFYISGGVFGGMEMYMQLFYFMAVIFALRTILEYVFARAKKRHIISVTYTSICLFVAFIFLLLS